MFLMSALPLSLLAAQPAATQIEEGAQVVDDLTACRTIEDATERLACYDSASRSLEEATENDEIVIVERAEIEETRRRSFGFRLPNLGIFGGDDDDEEDTAPQRLTSTITSITESGYSRYRFGLADGSVWGMSEASSRLRPRRGDTIVIREAALGSFLASIDDAPAVRVRREN